MAVNINVPSQVKTYANLAAFPATGALKTIYIAEDTNKTYRWTGSVYTEISASAAMTWGAIGGTLSNQTDLQSALDAKVPTSRTLTINGVTQDLSADRTFTISTGITIGSTAITSGTVGRVLFQGAGNVVQQSSSLFWDATNNRFGIGTSSPAYALEISSASGSQTAGILVKNTGGGSSDYSSFNLLNNNNILAQVFNTSSGYTISPVIGANGFGHYTNGSGGITLWADGGVIKFITGTGANAFGSQKMTLATTGNLLINTATDAGYRLDVNGTTRATLFYSGASNYADSIGIGISVDGANFSSSFNASNANMLLLKGSSRFAYLASVGAMYYFCGRYNGGASTWIPTDFMKLQLSGSEMWGISSGTATTNAININLNLNFTGGTSTVKGIYYNPTLTSMTGVTHHAFHSTSGRIRFENLPTSSAGLSAGDIWNDAGTLKIV